MNSRKLLFIFGTRPEAIKLAPLILEFRKHPRYAVLICVTAQHREMLDQVLEFFGIRPDYDLNLMKPGQTLFDVTADGLKAIEKVLLQEKPDLVFTQGDTTTSFIGSLAAYYCRIKVAHVEAGLRSGDRYSPFPEEANRILADHLSEIHFAPTDSGKQNLSREGIQKNVYCVGNTVIDALLLGMDLIKERGDEYHYGSFKYLNFNNRIVLITGHRRESFGNPFRNICFAIKDVAEKFPNVEFVYPVHLNPNVREPVNNILSGIPNVHLIAPLDYEKFLWLMNKSYLILTDSGGLQEEAPALGKPVLVMRDVTERQEGIDAGTARLTGTDPAVIVKELTLLLSDQKHYDSMAKAVNPYGDGTSSRQIVRIIDSLIN